jgi:hypothetical protein
MAFQEFGLVAFYGNWKKKKLTDIGFGVFCWILDLVQKLTGRLSRIMFIGLFSWYWI